MKSLLTATFLLSSSLAFGGTYYDCSAGFWAADGSNQSDQNSVSERVDLENVSAFSVNLAGWTASCGKFIATGTGSPSLAGHGSEASDLIECALLPKEQTGGAESISSGAHISLLVPALEGVHYLFCDRLK